ncbi:hypothetical protein C8R44DRAFT_731493 [Mycena epipterygia]|nr:hypothetical protein C8R44DRAFT_731493 [Mycena epipterygia]
MFARDFSVAAERCEPKRYHQLVSTRPSNVMQVLVELKRVGKVAVPAPVRFAYRAPIPLATSTMSDYETYGDPLLPSSQAGSDYEQLESQHREIERTEMRRKYRAGALKDESLEELRHTKRDLGNARDDLKIWRKAASSSSAALKQASRLIVTAQNIDTIEISSD